MSAQLPPVPPGADPYVSISTAARQLKRTRMTVYKMIRRGELVRATVAERGAVTVASIKAYQAAHPEQYPAQPGQPGQ